MLLDEQGMKNKESLREDLWKQGPAVQCRTLELQFPISYRKSCDGSRRSEKHGPTSRKSATDFAIPNWILLLEFMKLLHRA